MRPLFDSGDIPLERTRPVMREAYALRAEAAEIAARSRRILASAYRAALRKKSATSHPGVSPSPTPNDDEREGD